MSLFYGNITVFLTCMRLLLCVEVECHNRGCRVLHLYPYKTSAKPAVVGLLVVRVSYSTHTRLPLYNIDHCKTLDDMDLAEWWWFVCGQTNEIKVGFSKSNSSVDI